MVVLVLIGIVAAAAATVAHGEWRYHRLARRLDSLSRDVAETHGMVTWMMPEMRAIEDLIVSRR